jgi:hypothetical protein
MLSSLTYKIVAFSEVDQLNADDCLDWATEMLTLGYETPNLLMLASFNKPTSYFEVEPYVKDAIRELKLRPQSGESGILSYVSYHVQQIADGKDVKQNLAELYSFCQDRDYEKSVYDFYLLYWAWDQTRYDDQPNSNHYWEGATKENIEETVVAVAKDWIVKNEKHYAQRQQ